MWEGERGEGAPIVCEEVAYKVKFSGGGLEAVESEGEGDGGILHLRPVLGQTQLHGQSSLGRLRGGRGGEGGGEEGEEGEREGEEKREKEECEINSILT